jgi:hypothetical protein
MHRSAEPVNIGRNSETENPIDPHFIACSRQKQRWHPYLFIKYWNNMYLAILWCLQYVCKKCFSRNMVRWTWHAYSTFQTICYRVPDTVWYQRWRHLLALVHVNGLETYNGRIIIPWVHAYSKIYTLWFLMAIVGLRMNTMPCILWQTQFWPISPGFQ